MTKKINLKKEVVEVAEVVEVKENAPAPAPVVEVVEVAENIPAPAPVPAEEEEEKKERKERAKMRPDALGVAPIIEKRLACFLEDIVKGLADKQNAEELAKAKLFGAGHSIVLDLVAEIETRFKEYAPNSYKGKNPSHFWLMCDNTAKASQNEQKKNENVLAKLYNVTDSAVYNLLENSKLAKRDAENTINNFMPYLYISNNSLLKERLEEIDKAGIKTILVSCQRYENPAEYIKAFMSYGYMLGGIESVPAREYDGINKKFDAVNDLYKFVKA